MSNQHILMSVLVVMVYIIPFTLLVLLGPLLQAKSHHKALHWVNRIKPFLDAFYGPYTSWYRYWPGILLLARLVTLVVFSSFYDDSKLKLVMASVIVLVFLFISMLTHMQETALFGIFLPLESWNFPGYVIIHTRSKYHQPAVASCVHAGTISGSVWHYFGHYFGTSYLFCSLSSLQGSALDFWPCAQKGKANAITPRSSAS